MPDGLIIMKYNERKGPDIQAQYPEGKLKISNETLMHIFNLHAFTEPGLASLSVDRVNIATYYSGKETDYFIILVLNLLENPDDFEEKLVEISKEILKDLENKEFINLLPSLFKKVSKSSK